MRVAAWFLLLLSGITRGQEPPPRLEGLALESSLATLQDLRSRAADEPSRLLALERATWELLLRAANQARTNRLRLQLLRDAADVLEEHLLHADLPAAAAARRTLALVLAETGAAFGEEADGASDRDRQNLCRREAARALGRALRLAQELIAGERTRAGADPAAAVRLAQAQLLRGILLRDLAVLAGRDRAAQLQKARTELTELILTCGEETWLGMAARLEVLRALELDGRRDEAAIGYQEVLAELCDNAAAPAARGDRNSRDELLRRALSFLVPLLQGEGQREPLLRWCARALSALQASAPNDPVPGDRTLDRIQFHRACALLEPPAAPERAEAEAVLRRLARDHDGFLLGSLARQRLATLPAGTAAGAPWRPAAQVAIDAVRQGRTAVALASLPGLLSDASGSARPEERLVVALDLAFAHTAAGDGNGAVTALLAAARQAQGSPEAWLFALDRMARGAARLRAERAPGAPEPPAAVAARQELARTLADDDTAAAAYLEGLGAFDRGRFAEALAWFPLVKEDATVWPVARARQGLSLLRTGDAANGTTILRDALRRGDRPVDPTDPTPLATAAQTAAARMAAFELALVAVQDLAAGRDPGADLDPALEVIARAAASPWITAPRRATLAVLQARAWLERGRLGPALRLWPLIRHEHGDAPAATALAALLCQAHLPRVAALRREWERTHARDTLDRLQTELRQALLLALDHLDGGGQPAFAWLRRTTQMALDAGEHGVAARLLETTLRRFASQREHQDTLEHFVRPDLAEVQLRRQDYQGALDLATELAGRHPESARLLELRARALGGWVERGADGTLLRWTGLGRAAEAVALLRADQAAPTPTATRGSLAWYRQQLLLMWCLSQDGASSESATALLRALGDEGLARLRGLGAEGEALFQLFAALAPR